MIEDISLLDAVVSGCCLVCGLIGAYKSWRANKNALLVKKGVDDMRKKIVYRSEDYQVSNPDKVPTFSRYVKTYRLNEDTGLLEESGEIDIKELVNSSLDSSLTKILERFGFDNVVEMNSLAMSKYAVEDSNEIAVARGLSSDIDRLQKSSMEAERLKKVYGLDPDLSVEEVYSKLASLKLSLDSFIASNLSETKEGDNNEKKDK